MKDLLEVKLCETHTSCTEDVEKMPTEGDSTACPNKQGTVKVGVFENITVANKWKKATFQVWSDCIVNKCASEAHSDQPHRDDELGDIPPTPTPLMNRRLSLHPNLLPTEHLEGSKLPNMGRSHSLLMCGETLIPISRDQSGQHLPDIDDRLYPRMRQRSSTVPTFTSVVGLMLFRKMYLAKLNRSAQKQVEQDRKEKEAKEQQEPDSQQQESTEPIVKLPPCPRFSDKLSLEAQMAMLVSYDEKLVSKLSEKHPFYKKLYRRSMTPDDPALRHRRAIDREIKQYVVTPHIQGAMDLIDSLHVSQGDNVTSKRHQVLVKDPREGFIKWRREWSETMYNQGNNDL